LRKRKILALSLSGAVLALAACAALIAGRCLHAQRDFHPIRTAFPPELKRAQDSLPKYRRAEESTYLTYTEWYLVFNPQEYADFIARERPSRFPYLASIRQCWSGYCEACGVTHGRYPFNGSDYLMLSVISVSFSVEYAIKGAWESTLGRASEWTAGGRRVPEDEYAAKVAREYGAFIPTDPWYMFPFRAKLTGLWRETPFWGKDFLRKCERKVFLSLEYGVKAGYAWIIKAATRSVYGIAETEVDASLLRPQDSLFTDPRLRRIEAVGDSLVIVALPHYQGFTDVLPGLARKGARFLDVCGNDEIMGTIIAPGAAGYHPPAGQVLFTMPVLTATDSVRIALQIPVSDLTRVLSDLGPQGARLEHLFDY